MTSSEVAAGSKGAVGEFERILAPVTLAEFFHNYWNRRPLYLPGPADRFVDLLNRDAFTALLPECRQLKAGFYDRKGWFCELPIVPDQVKRRWEAGMTICAGVLPPGDRRSAVIESYRRSVAFAGEVYFNAYMSPDGHGFTLHLDDHPVFVLQIEGKKQWSVSPEIGVPDPIRGFSFPPDRDRLRVPWGSFERPDEEQFLQFTLEPGDALYLPAGTWHKARAIGFSLALTMASSRYTPLSLAQMAMMEQLDRYPALRQPLWGADTHSLGPSGVPTDLQPCFEAAAASLRDWAGQLDAQTLYRLWRAAIRQREGG